MTRLTRLEVARFVTQPQLAEAEIYRVIGPRPFRGLEDLDHLCWACFTWIDVGSIYEVHYRRVGSVKGERRRKLVHAGCFDAARKELRSRRSL